MNDLPIEKWITTGFPFDHIAIKSLMDYLFSEPRPTVAEINNSESLKTSPLILEGKFDISEELLDTYLNTAGWGKGIALINGYNLGRYWPRAGPQLTLYVPSVYLRRGQNTLILVELEYVPDNRKMQLQNTAILD